MTNRRQSDGPFDVVVIGGGPAGATVGTLLAKHGRRVCLFERSTGPRFHVGESLVPGTYATLQRLGMLEKLERSAFPRKYSVQFVTADGVVTRPFYFSETNPHESSVTWQVWRATFDRLLLENAVEHGCEVRRNAHVTDVLFEDDRAVGVKVRERDGETRLVRAQVVVDAAGQSSPIVSRLDLKVPIRELRQASIWSYFKDVHRDSGIDEGATIIFSTRGKRSWFWFIPLPGGVTSIGVVSNLDYLLGDRMPPEEVFAEQLDDCPRLKERFTNARRVKPFHVTKDFSYMTERAAGDGWVLVGDAFGFLDPVYSTGVLLAFTSGEFAADAIHEGLAKGDLSADQLGAWEAKHRKAIASFRRLVYAFYSYDFSFGRFVRAHPQFQRNLIDLLVGDVYKEGIDEIFTAMGDLVPYDGAPPVRARRDATATEASENVQPTESDRKRETTTQ